MTMTMTLTTPKRRPHPAEVVEVVPRMKVDAQAQRALPLSSQAVFEGSGRAPVAWAVAAHGGAGATTLGRVLAPVGDAGSQWPVHDEFTYCVVVCRSTRTGLDAAQSAVLQAQSGHAAQCQVLGVVIVADAPGRVPKPLVRRELVLEELSTVWRVPYLSGIRESNVADLAVWQPQPNAADDDVQRGRRKKQAVTEDVPQVLAQLGEDIFQAAFVAHVQKDENK